MKRYNFSCYSSEDGTFAVSRTTTTKPADFVGEARITRFRLSRGAIPIFFLEPSKRGYTSEEALEIQRQGYTPTDIMFYIVQFSQALSKPAQYPNNSCQYLYSSLRPECTLFQNEIDGEFDLSTAMLLMECTICVAYNIAPVFEERDGEWYLVSPKYPIYDWDSLNSDSIGLKQVSKANLNNNQGLGLNPEVKLQIKEENGFPLFHIDVREQILDHVFTNIQPQPDHTVTYDSQSNYYTGPILFMNEGALELCGMNITESGQITKNVTLFGGDGIPITFYAPPCSLKNQSADYDAFIRNAPDRRSNFNVNVFATDPMYYKEVTERGINVSWVADFDPYLITVPKNIYPVSQILILSDELDFNGESICINTEHRQGVVDPSWLHILKSFYVGIDNTVEIDASDFIYIDDSLNQMPVILNNPRICTLTFRVYFLLKTGELEPCALKDGKGFTLQITLS